MSHVEFEVVVGVDVEDVDVVVREAVVDVIIDDDDELPAVRLIVRVDCVDCADAEKEDVMSFVFAETERLVAELVAIGVEMLVAGEVELLTGAARPVPGTRYQFISGSPRH